MIRLRGHHLICLHFFSGEGYDTDFIANLMDVLKRCEGEEIEVVEEADDICLKCPYLQNSQCFYTKDAEEEIKRMDKEALKLLEVSTTEKIKWHEIKIKLPQIFKMWFEQFCIDCNWLRVCRKNKFFMKITAFTID